MESHIPERPILADSYWTEQDWQTGEILRPEIERVLTAYYPPGEPVLLNHKGLDKNPDGFVPSRDFLLNEAHISREILKRVFTKGHFERHPFRERRLWVDGGELLQLPDDGVDIYSLPPRDAIQYMAEKLALLYEMNSQSLDTQFPHGFNYHGLEHVISVVEEGLYLADEAKKQRDDIGTQTYNMVVLKGMTHDAANGIAGRWRHSLALAPLIAARIPQATANETLWERFMNGNALHDEPVLKIFLNHYGGLKSDGKIDIDRAIPIMREHMRAEDLILIASDKRQDGRDREPRKARHWDALEEDKNDLAAMMREREKPIISPDGTVCTFRLKYSPQIDPSGKFTWAGKSSTRAEYFPTGHRVRLPADIHKLWREKGIPHSLSVEKAWIDLYYGQQDRFAAEVAAAFALFPKLKEFRLEDYDPLQPDTLDPQYKRQLEEARVFHLGRVEQDIAHYQDLLANPVLKQIA